MFLLSLIQPHMLAPKLFPHLNFFVCSLWIKAEHQRRREKNRVIYFPSPRISPLLPSPFLSLCPLVHVYSSASITSGKATSKQQINYSLFATFNFCFAITTLHCSFVELTLINANKLSPKFWLKLFKNTCCLTLVNFINGDNLPRYICLYENRMFASKFRCSIIWVGKERIELC